MPGAGTVPAIEKDPPTTRSPFGIMIMSETPPLRPPPIVCHSAPSNRRIANDGVMYVSKWPPATMSPLLRRASAFTVGENPVIPPPNSDHDVPFQRAIARAGTPPMSVNDPPASRSPPGSGSSAFTPPLTAGAAPSRCHAVPSNRQTPPALATSSPLPSTASAVPRAGRPSPRLAHNPVAGS